MNKLCYMSMLGAWLSIMILFGYVVYSSNVTEQFYIAHGYNKVMVVGYEFPVWTKGSN